MIVIENGREREYVASLHLSNTGIQEVYEFPPSMTSLESAISGYIPEM